MPYNYCPLVSSSASLECVFGGECNNRLVSLPSQNILNITNDNFFTVQAYNLTVQALFDKTVVGKADMKNVTTVKPLTDKTVSTSPHYQLLYCRDVSFCKPLNIVT